MHNDAECKFLKLTIFFIILGIMTQMILTIPLTQPGSPQSLMNASAQSVTSPAIGASGRQSSSSPHSRSVRNRSHHHGLPQCSANSPPIASTVPPSTSPDYSGPGGTIPSSLLNISPHLVSQSLGAHIPLVRDFNKQHYKLVHTLP